MVEVLDWNKPCAGDSSGISQPNKTVNPSGDVLGFIWRSGGNAVVVEVLDWNKPCAGDSSGISQPNKTVNPSGDVLGFRKHVLNIKQVVTMLRLP